MELQFDKTVCPYLQRVISMPQTQELTQELRLPDTMPDIGRILGCWGQPLIRGKEWNGTGVSVNGGVMVWILYAPEDGTQLQSMDAWLPFQMKWEIPQTKHDGFLSVSPYLKAMDCRSLSARKVMIRSGLTLMTEALAPAEAEIFQSTDVPPDIQLLKQNYPVELPQEAGEKPFRVEEELMPPGGLPKAVKILRIWMNPRAAEQKVMAGKLVFRGCCDGHMLYMSEDEGVHCWDFALSFSQLADLDRDYSSAASAKMDLIMTGIETDFDTDGKLHIKCGIAAQYVICDRCMISVVEDAYSNQRQVQPKLEQLNLPVRLDVCTSEMAVTALLGMDCQKILETAALWDCPTLRQSGNEARVEMTCQIQSLYYNDAGQLQSTSVMKQESWAIDSDADNDVALQLNPGMPDTQTGPEGVQITASAMLTAEVSSRSGIPMVTGLALGDIQDPDPARASLILRRCGSASVWELAKNCGSTVEAICAANQLQQEPTAEQLLLIPIA